jgi:predicted small lipoprotein YifL
MKLRLIVAFAIAFALAGCGVKGDLEKPNSQTAQKGEKDPSKPPSTIGR